MVSKYEIKNVSEPNETKEIGRAKLEIVNVNGNKVARFVLKKGWKWSTDVKPVVKTEWCEASHFQYQISGIVHGTLKDGTEFEIKPGDVSSIPAGHDMWVVGDEPAVGIEFTASNISKEFSKQENK